MAHKSLKIALKNDRVERVEEAMVKIGLAVNSNIVRLAKSMDEIQKAQELFYDTFMARTMKGRFKGLVKWLSKKKASTLRRK
jgi:hypothetical protein